MVMKFPIEELLCRHLLVVLGVQKSRDLQFSIPATTASLITTSNHTSVIWDTNIEMIANNDSCSNECDNLLNNNVCDSEIITTNIMPITPIDAEIPDVNSVSSDVVDNRYIPIYQL